MEAFCSNTLGQTQCNGLTSAAFNGAVSLGILQGIIGLILGGYLTWLSQSPKGATLAWPLAVEGTITLIAISLEAASRIHPGNLGQFVLIDRAAAGLGIVTLIFYFIFHVIYAGCLAKRYNAKIVPIIVFLLASLAIVALAFNIVALLAISYEELPGGIRAGARDINEFLNPSKQALALMLSFMCLTLITQIVLHSLLRRRKTQLIKQQEARRQKAISSFSNSTIEEKGGMEFEKPIHRYFETLIPSTMLAIIRTSLAFSSQNTIIAQRAIGLIEYTGYVLIIAFSLRFTEERTFHYKNLFSQLSSNPSLTSFETPSPQPQAFPRTVQNPSILTRANMASFGVGTSHPTTPKSPPRYPRKPPPSQKPPSIEMKTASRRVSCAAQSAFSSLAPEDSASLAAFRPRPDLPPLNQRTRTKHGPNGSELAPLREDLVEQLNGSTI